MNQPLSAALNLTVGSARRIRGCRRSGDRNFMMPRSSTPVLSAASIVAMTLATVAQADDLQTRCQSPGVIRCIGFDQASDIAATPRPHRLEQ